MNNESKAVGWSDENLEAIAKEDTRWARHICRELLASRRLLSHIKSLCEQCGHDKLAKKILEEMG